MKVLIVGGGVAGLAIAWRLSIAGAQVEVVERGICGRGASWSAAGMIAPGGESTGGTGMLARFAGHASEEWPRFSTELEQAAGLEIDSRKTGSIIAAEDESQAEALRSRANEPVQWLDRDRLLEREPRL